MEMKVTFRNKRALAALLTIVLLIGTFGTFNVNAQRRSRGYYGRPHHSRAKGALIGGAVGLIGGALIGGEGGGFFCGRGGGRTRLLVPRKHDKPGTR